MKNFKKHLLAVLALSSLSACGDLSKRPISSSHVDSNIVTDSNVSSSSAISGSGEVHYNETEGGHFVIWADDGNTYLPVSLSKDLQVDGLRVEFTAQPARNLYSNAMSGDLITLTSIAVVE